MLIGFKYVIYCLLKEMSDAATLDIDGWIDADESESY